MGSYNGKVCKDEEEAKAYVTETIKAHPVVLFTKRFSPYCWKATNAFKSINVQYEEILLSGRPDCQIIQDVLLEMTGARTVPRVFIHEKCIGGGNETSAFNKEGKLKKFVDKEETPGEEKENKASGEQQAEEKQQEEEKQEDKPADEPEQAPQQAEEPKSEQEPTQEADPKQESQ